MSHKLLVCVLLIVACCGFKNYSYKLVSKHNIYWINNNDDTLPSCFLALSDIHLHDGKNQDSAECNCGDSGNDLWDSAKKKINQVIEVNHPKFLLALGDFPFHFKGNINAVENSFKTVYTELITIAKKYNLPLIIAPGNNDSYTGDYQSLTNDHPVLFLPGKNTVACYADSTLETSLGCYAAYPLGKKNHLKIIVLNTVIFSAHKENNGSPTYTLQKQNADATIEMKWFIKQLQQAKNNNDNVLIAMHIPPGFDAYFGKSSPDSLKNLWSTSLQFKGSPLLNDFLDEIYNYKNNIVGILSSHSHMDGLRLLIDDTTITTSKIASLLVSVPGIAPGHGNNPSMKMVTYNPHKNFELENFTTYFMNYDNHNRIVKNFDSSYTFSNQFQCKADTSMLANVTKIFVRDSSRLNNYVDSIYFTKTKSILNNSSNVAKAIYVIKQ